jgi:hypothetical protein
MACLVPLDRVGKDDGAMRANGQRRARGQSWHGTPCLHHVGSGLAGSDHVQRVRLDSIGERAFVEHARQGTRSARCVDASTNNCEEILP